MDERAQLKAAGFSDAEIDEYFSSQGPTKASAPTLERMPDGPFAQSRMTDAPVKREMSGLGKAVMGANQVARGATLGLSDMAGAGIASLLTGTPYKETRAAMDASNRQFADENPATNLALNVGGAVLPTLLSGGAGGVATAARMAPAALAERAAANVASRLVPQAAQGAGIVSRGVRAVARPAIAGTIGGAAGGAGYAAGDQNALEEAVKGGITGGVMGGAIGAVAPAAKATAATLADVLGLRNFGSGVAAGTVPTAPKTDGVMARARALLPTPDNFSVRADKKALGAITDNGNRTLTDALTDAQWQNRMSGNEGMVLDAGGSKVQRLVRGSRSKSTDASEMIDAALEGRDGRLRSGLRGDVEATVSGKVNTVKTERALRQAGKTESAPLYESVDPKPVNLSGESVEVLTERDPRGIMRVAHKKLRDLAQSQGRDIPPLFVKMDRQVPVRNAVGDIMEDANGNPMFTTKKEWGLARNTLSVEEVDGLKQQIRDLAVTGTKSGKTISRREAQAMLANLDNLMDDALTQQPELGQALRAKGVPSGAADAIQLAEKGGALYGKKGRAPSFMTASPDEAESIVEGLGYRGRDGNVLSESAREAYDQGKGASLYRAASKDARGTLRKIARDEDFQEKLRRTQQTRDAGSADELIERAKVRDAQVVRGDKIKGGSQTDDKRFDGGEGIGDAIRAKSGLLTYAPIRGALDLLMGQSLAGLQGKAGQELGKRATLRGQDYENYIRYLMQLSESDAAKANIRGSAGRSALAALIGSQ